MSENDIYTDMVWKTLSYIVFLAIYAIVWRNLYKQSQRDVDEAYAGQANVPVSTTPMDPMTRFLNAFLLRNNFKEEPPYSLFTLLVNIFMIIIWLLLYLGILYFGVWFFDYFIIQNSVSKSDAPNYVHVVLTAFMGSEITFITEACLTCLSFVTLMSIVVYVGFQDLMLKRETAKLLAKAAMIVILVAVPIVSLIRLVKYPILSILD